MAPPGRGGRPRNAWTSSRCRKLVRLYTLTKLSKEEIRKVLAADDFSPCPRNIQTKLRELLPGDYGKSHRIYRPSDDVHMKLRFDYLRRCKKGRISKERAVRLPRKSTVQTKLNATGALSKAQLEAFEGCSHAFRNYASPFESRPIPLSEDLLNSQPVTSSLLLLDGSSLRSGQGASTFDNNESSSLIDVSDRPRLMPQADTTVKAVRGRSIPTPRSEEIGMKISSLRGLGKQLADKYSEDRLKHISSVWRYSSSNSWRSSLTSISSRASSLLSQISNRDRLIKNDDSPNTVQMSDNLPNGAVSGIPTGRQRPPSAPDSWGPVDKDPFYDTYQVSSTETDISHEEQEIWNELVDEKSLEFSLAPHPSYSDISPNNRKCCGSFFWATLHVCETCGLNSEYRRAVEFVRANYIRCNTLDFYNNTPLHYAAAGIKQDEFWKISYMIDHGFDTDICNTSGETFLHVLCRKGPRSVKDTAEFLEILQKLSPRYSELKFSFMRCDYHGRTILHNLFQHEDDFTFPVGVLAQIFGIMKPSLDTLDNAGVSVAHLLRGICKKMRNRYSERDLRKLEFEISKLCDKSLKHSQYRTQIAVRHGEAGISSWLEGLRQAHRITRIDSLGDTPLTALIKCWRTGRDGENLFRQLIERMIDLGAMVHMRDRNGDTALAIAARRGLRSAVTLLLEKGSYVHSRNYRGIGILRQVMCSMRVAEGDDRLWALRYSCYLAMIDAGATSHPTDQDEWMLPASERQCLKANSATLSIPTSPMREPNHWSDEPWPRKEFEGHARSLSYARNLKNFV